MIAFHCRRWLTVVCILFATSAQAGTTPITLVMTAIGDLGLNLRPGQVAPNTLTLSAFKSSSPAPTNTELTLSGLQPDSVDRMLHYMPSDPPSYAWTITAANANTFGVNWLEFQSHLNESRAGDVFTQIFFFNPSAAQFFNPAEGDTDTMLEAINRAGIKGHLWAKDFQLHEVKISIDYYFWHPVLDGLRAVQIRAEIRGEARIVPEPSAGVILIGLCHLTLGRFRRSF